MRPYHFRQDDGSDSNVLAEAVKLSGLGKAWPYLADHPENVEVHLAAIPERSRIVAHIVNYDLRNPSGNPAAAVGPWSRTPPARRTIR